MANKKVNEIKLNIIKESTIRLTLVGDSPLILHKKSRSFEHEELFKQSNPKGTTIPDNIDSKKNYNQWEKLITSITWRDPIVFHDDDPSLYCKEEWNDYLTNNAPCILQNALKGSFTEAFTTFYKEATGKAGTDFKRAINMNNVLFPIKFVDAGYVRKLVPNNTVARTNVLAEYNIFNGWSCDVEIVFPKTVFPEKTVLEVICAAGKYIGVGTQRKNGYGRWHVENATIIN